MNEDHGLPEARDDAETSALVEIASDLVGPTQRATVPITFVRCALFSVAKSGDKLDRKEIAAEVGPLGMQVVYSGPYLNQDHFKAWQAAVYLARRNDGMGGKEFVVSASEMLRAMGKQYRDHDQRNLLWRLMDDLQGTKLNIYSCRSRYVGSLIDAAAQDLKTGRIAVRLNPDLAQLLTDETIESDMMRMMEIGRDQIALWLNNYFASWGTYRNVTVQELHRLCGTNLDMRRFRYRLKKAGDKLLGGVRPFITDFWVDENDLVHVVKTKTPVKLLSDKDREALGLVASRKKSEAADKAASSRARVAL